MARIITTAFFVLILYTASAKDYCVTNYGAIGDAKTNNTACLQKIIDMATAKGGGRIVFPQGTYLTGTLQMKSGIELHLETGATLLGSPESRDYKSVVAGGAVKDTDNSRIALIVAVDAHNISLSGLGTIDGNGLAVALDADSLHHAGIVVDKNYNYRRHRTSERPKLFYFEHCGNIRVSGLHLRNSAGWGLSFDLCRGIVLEDIKVFNRAFWNNDGIDISDCRNVVVRNSNINAADDGICLKSHHADACNDSILIENCEIRSSASAVKFGTASYGGFKNISVKNIRVFDTFRSAIALECVDGGVLENVSVSDIVAFNTGNAIFIRLGARTDDRLGALRNVQISRLYCEVPFGRPDINYDLRGPEVDFFHNPFPSSITGIPNNNIQNVTLSDIEIVCPGRASKAMAYAPLSRLDDINEAVKAYPEFSMFGELPAWGFYIRHVDGITMRNIRLRLKDTDFRPAIVMDDVSGDLLENVEAPNGIYRHNME